MAPGSHFVILADMNGDGRPDIVVSHGTRYVSVLLNKGGGTFAPAKGSPYDLGSEVYALAAADFNRDRHNDIIAATVNSVTVLLGDGARFVAGPGSPYRAGPGAYNVAVGDLNEDGMPDIVASSFGSNAVTVLLAQAEPKAGDRKAMAGGITRAR